jgi:hypothetical protein
MKIYVVICFIDYSDDSKMIAAYTSKEEADKLIATFNSESLILNQWIDMLSTKEHLIANEYADDEDGDDKIIERLLDDVRQSTLPDKLKQILDESITSFVLPDEYRDTTTFYISETELHHKYSNLE